MKNDPDYQAALLKRGITDPSLVMIDPWSSGYFGIPEDEGKRLVRALAWVRPAEGENGYAYPVTGLIPVVDVNKMEIIRIEDYGAKPIPPTDGAYTPEEANSYPIDIRQDVNHWISFNLKAQASKLMVILLSGKNGIFVLDLRQEKGLFFTR